MHFNVLKIIKKEIFNDTWKLYEIQIVVGLYEVLLELSHVFICLHVIYSSFSDRVFVTKTASSTQPNMFPIWPFTEHIYVV